VVTNVVSASQINVFWNAAPASENVTSYNLRINNSHVIRGITYTSFPVTGLTPGTTYTFEIQAVNSSGVESNWSPVKSAATSTNSTAESSGKSDSTASDSAAPSLLSAPDTGVSFVGYDTSTQGNWVNHYGRLGRIIVGEEPHLPDWAKFAVTGQGFHVWSASTGDPRALIKSGNNNDRIATALFSPNQFEMAFNFTDGQTRRLALYSLDWEGNSRNQTFEIIDASTGAVIDTKTINNFHNGVYVVWQVRGRFTVRVRNAVSSGANPVISGVFVDNP
jgi:chitodextrinase